MQVNFDTFNIHQGIVFCLQAPFLANTKTFCSKLNIKYYTSIACIKFLLIVSWMIAYGKLHHALPRMCGCFSVKMIITCIAITCQSNLQLHTLHKQPPAVIEAI